EKKDMDDEPDKPRRKAAPMAFERPLDIGDRGLSSDGCHVAFVEVAERGVDAAAVAAEIRGNQSGDALCRVGPHLHGRLRDAGDLLSVLFEVSKIDADEYLEMTGRVKMLIDEDA